MQRRGAGQQAWAVAPQFEIVAFGNRFQKSDALLVIDRYAADERHIEIRSRGRGQCLKDGRFEYGLDTLLAGLNASNSDTAPAR